MDEVLASTSIDTTDLRTLVTHASWIHGDRKLEEAYEEFQKHHFEFIAVLDDNRRVLGLCSREELGMLFSIRYGRELYAKKLVQEHLSRPATIVNIGDRVSSVLQSALERDDTFFTKMSSWLRVIESTSGSFPCKP